MKILWHIIQSLRAFRRTPLPAILCPDVPRDASEVSPRALKTSVGGCVLRPYGVRNRGNMGPKWLPGSLLELLGLLKASWSCLAGLLGRSGRASWAPLGMSWALLGRSWRHLERSWAGLGGLLGALGRVLGALVAVLEASWTVLGALGSILRAN